MAFGRPAYKAGDGQPITYLSSWSTYGEAGLSREYGGIHFRDADAHGLNLGRAVGTNTWNKAQPTSKASPLG